MVICHRCEEYQLNDHEWFCRYCGEPRNSCPECGRLLEGDICEDCGTVRLAPCRECESLIEANKQVCPKCSADASDTIPYSLANLVPLLGIALVAMVMFAGWQLTHPMFALLTIVPIGIIFILAIILLTPIMIGATSFLESQQDTESIASTETGRKKYTSDRYGEESLKTNRD